MIESDNLELVFVGWQFELDLYCIQCGRILRGGRGGGAFFKTSRNSKPFSPIRINVMYDNLQSLYRIFTFTPTFE